MHHGLGLPSGETSTGADGHCILSQVSPGGHCPQAEAPELVGRCLAAWIQQVASGGEPLLGVGQELTDSDGVVLRRSDDSPTNPLEWCIYIVHRASTSVQRAAKRVFG